MDPDEPIEPPAVEPTLDLPIATPGQRRALELHAAKVIAILTLNLGREPSARMDDWRSQEHPELWRWVSAASYPAPDHDEALSLLRTLGTLLVRLGWQPRTAADGRPRIRGAAGPFELIASAEGAALLVRLTSDPLHIPGGPTGPGLPPQPDGAEFEEAVPSHTPHMDPEESVAADPMFSVLRERHPDVDIVLLPDTAVPPVDAAAATSEQLAALAEQTEIAVDDLLGRVELESTWPGSCEREFRWRHDDAGRTYAEVVVVLTELPDGDNVQLLRAVGNCFLELGWQARPVPGDRPRLAARRGAWTATAAVRPAALDLYLRSGLLLTAQEAAR